MHIPKPKTQQPDLVFFDIETPNRSNNSICSIGIIRVSPTGSILAAKYFLIDPEATFDQINVDIHGITANDVIGTPNFAVLWDQELESLFSNANLVAHNAIFDMTVLRKSLARYERTLAPCSYACTMKMSQHVYPEFPKHKLNVVCSCLDIPMRSHHEALSDAESCYRLFNHMVLSGAVKMDSCWSRYDFSQGNSGIITRREELEHQNEHAQKVIDNLPDVVERNAGGVDMEGSVFCLTGEFLSSPSGKQPIIDHLVAMGGTHSKNLTLKCDYLIVGSLGSPQWKNGNYGSKIEKAMENVEKGKSNVRIIDEASIIDLDQLPNS